MAHYIDDLISKYRTKGLLVDTNLLLVYFVGMYDPDRISKFKRTMAFTVDEFRLLAKFFEVFEKVVTTPNILTEVSNLSGHLPEKLSESFNKDFAGRIPRLQEHYASSTSLATSTHFNTFGLTDSGIVELVKKNYLVLTDDLSLYGLLQNLGVDAINFNHLRSAAWRA